MGSLSGDMMATLAPPRPLAGRLAAERRFFLAMTIALTVLVVWGFSSSFFLRGQVPMTVHSYLDDPTNPIRWLYIVHGLVFTSWMALLLAQAGLVTVGNVALHRRLGQVAVMLVPLMVALGLAGGVYASRHGFHDIPFPPAVFLAVPLLSVMAFAVTVAIAMRKRHVPATHKRLMLLATMMIVGAGTARISLLHGVIPPWFDATLVLLLPLWAWDWTTLRRIHPATLWGSLVLAVVAIGAVPIGMTPVWLALVKPITG